MFSINRKSRNFVVRNIIPFEKCLKFPSNDSSIFYFFIFIYLFIFYGRLTISDAYSCLLNPSFLYCLARFEHKTYPNLTSLVPT
jgi:hypothetical protein